MKIDEADIIEKLRMYLKIPVFRESIAHKVIEWEISFKEAIAKYKEMVGFFDPGEQKETSETGFVMEKVSTGYIVKPVLAERKQKVPSKSARSTPPTPHDKNEILRTILLYLLEFDDYLNSTYEQLVEKWKPLIEKGIIQKNTIES